VAAFKPLLFRWAAIPIGRSVGYNIYLKNLPGTPRQALRRRLRSLILLAFMGTVEEGIRPAGPAGDRVVVRKSTGFLQGIHTVYE
jgi:hypothetical protein